ncbi:peptidase C14, caspase domain-containing protein [Hyaloraphidium curvatum]|nr:peptidase C14, caspase domain-containing protein [Hyaloraphidium curvatum]
MQLRGPVSGARPPRKVCLYIGICYFNGRRPLKGCINDVSAMRTFLSQTYGFPATEPDCLFLADSAPDPMYQPTRTNILWAMQWLIHGSQKGDSLILHFSGHGGRQKTEDYADEPDGYDETILPVDHLVSGEILDNEMNELLVQAAPAGVKLTAIFDACHSGSILDLMYVHDFDAAADEQRAVGAAAVNTAIGDQIKDSAPYRPPPAPGSTAPAQTGGNGVPHVTATLASFSNKAPASPTTSITCFSASTDYQESADTWLIGIPSGALSLAFISVLVEDPRGMTYAELFWRIRNWLAERGKQQTAMISTSGWRDLNAEIFSL